MRAPICLRAHTQRSHRKRQRSRPLLLALKAGGGCGLSDTFAAAKICSRTFTASSIKTKSSLSFGAKKRSRSRRRTREREHSPRGLKGEKFAAIIRLHFYGSTVAAAAFVACLLDNRSCKWSSCTIFSLSFPSSLATDSTAEMRLANFRQVANVASIVRCRRLCCYCCCWCLADAHANELAAQDE